jgi:hypothetical protein
MRPSGFTFRCRPRAGEADPRTGDARQGPAVLSLSRLAWRRLRGIDGFAAAPIRATTIAFAAVPLGSGCDRCPQAAGLPDQLEARPPVCRLGGGVMRITRWTAEPSWLMVTMVTTPGVCMNTSSIDLLLL